MDEELILPETDATITPPDDATPPAKPQPSRKTIIFITASILIFVSLVVSLIIVVTNKPSASSSSNDDSPQTTQSNQDNFYYDSEEFDNAMGQADFCLKNEDYNGAGYYLGLYSSPERMTSVQKYRFYSINAELYSESHLDDAELSQRYSELANNALQSIRKGGK